MLDGFDTSSPQAALDSASTILGQAKTGKRQLTPTVQNMLAQTVKRYQDEGLSFSPDTVRTNMRAVQQEPIPSSWKPPTQEDMVKPAVLDDSGTWWVGNHDLGIHHSSIFNTLLKDRKMKHHDHAKAGFEYNGVFVTVGELSRWLGDIKAAFADKAKFREMYNRELEGTGKK